MYLDTARPTRMHGGVTLQRTPEPEGPGTLLFSGHGRLASVPLHTSPFKHLPSSYTRTLISFSGAEHFRRQFPQYSLVIITKALESLKSSCNSHWIDTRLRLRCTAYVHRTVLGDVRANIDSNYRVMRKQYKLEHFACLTSALANPTNTPSCLPLIVVNFLSSPWSCLRLEDG